MENAQFERLLLEIAQSRRQTDQVAATLRDETRQSTAETAALLRGEMRQSAAETTALLRDEMRNSTAETVGMLRDEIRHSTAETVGMLRDEIRSTAEESRRHFGVVTEALLRNDQLLAEGFAMVDGKIDRLGETLRSDLAAESAETRAMIKLSYVELDRRLTTLETARAQ